jgi:hypothetical protein
VTARHPLGFEFDVTIDAATLAGGVYHGHSQHGFVFVQESWVPDDGLGSHAVILRKVH